MKTLKLEFELETMKGTALCHVPEKSENFGVEGSEFITYSFEAMEVSIDEFARLELSGWDWETKPTPDELKLIKTELIKLAQEEL